MTLRNMQGSDLRHVNLLLSKAFTHAHIQSGDTSARVPLCRTDFLQMYLAANPSSSFVVEEDQRIIAFCFGRLWGQLAWVGPLGVLPAKENHGYGKQVLTASLESLKAQGAITIGLEMPAQSSRNLAFYGKLGFQAGQPAVDMIRKISEEGVSLNNPFEAVRFRRVKASAEKALLVKTKELSRRLEPALDYTAEVELACEHGFGDGCVILESSEVVGFALAHTEPYSNEEDKRFLKVNALQLSPERPLETLDSILNVLERWAQEAALRGIYIRVPTRYSEAFRFLLQRGFFVVNTDLRLTLEGFGQQDQPSGVNLSKWQ